MRDRINKPEGLPYLGAGVTVKLKKVAKPCKRLVTPSVVGEPCFFTISSANQDHNLLKKGCIDTGG